MFRSGFFSTEQHKKTGWFTGLTERQQMLNTWLEQGREKMKVGKFLIHPQKIPNLET